MRIPGRDVPYVPVISLQLVGLMIGRIQYLCARGRSLFAPGDYLFKLWYSMYSKMHLYSKFAASTLYVDIRI